MQKPFSVMASAGLFAFVAFGAPPAASAAGLQDETAEATRSTPFSTRIARH
jgi:hypothetical protein